MCKLDCAEYKLRKTSFAVCLVILVYVFRFFVGALISAIANVNWLIPGSGEDPGTCTFFLVFLSTVRVNHLAMSIGNS